MGIEPTGHDSRRGPTGFEDQARHQTGSTSCENGIIYYEAQDCAPGEPNWDLMWFSSVIYSCG